MRWAEQLKETRECSNRASGPFGQLLLPCLQRPVFSFYNPDRCSCPRIAESSVFADPPWRNSQFRKREQPDVQLPVLLVERVWVFGIHVSEREYVDRICELLRHVVRK